MSFEITIKEKREVVEILGKEWKKVDDKEVLREVGPYGPCDIEEPKTRIKEIMGYTPEIERRVIREIEVLKQTVDTLDLAAVIKAVNNL